MALTANLGDDEPAPVVPPAITVPVEDTREPEPEPDEEDAPPPGRIELFSINGKRYYVPKKPGPNVALRYLRDTRRHGREYALAGMLEAMIGQDGLDALADYDDLTEVDMEAVMNAVERHVLGPLEKRGKR